MKKLLLILASTLLMASASAAPIDDSKLNDEQKAQVQKMITELEAKQADSKNISATAREETEKWVELGGNMGKAAVGAARELGVAANEFVGTPLGKITMAVVVYKVIGADVIGMFVGFGILVFFFGIAIALLRAKKYKNVEYDYKPTFFGMYNKRVVVSGFVDEAWDVGYKCAALLSVIIGMIVGLNIMF